MPALLFQPSTGLVKACLCALALVSETVCMAQVNSGEASSEWSSFVTPAIEPERVGPVADRTFQALKQGGPWREQPGSEALGESGRQLMRLSRHGRWADALALLKKDSPDPNLGDELGATPLSLAAAGGSVELVKELLRRGALADRRGAGGMTPLGAAAFNGHELVVRELLRRGARTDVAGSTGQLPLHLACATGRQGIVALLLAAGADVRAPNRQGRHALAEAAHFGQLGVMRQLVATGVSPGLPDEFGRNALHAAAMGQQRDAVAWLRQRDVVPSMALTQVLLDQADRWGSEDFPPP